MINTQESREKVLAALKILQEDSTTKEKFESIKELLKGVNPKVDQALGRVLRAWDDLEKAQQGEVIELSTENLPENTDKEKKRKRLLLLLIRSWKDLTSEVERVKLQLESGNEGKGEVSKIATFAKGPFGIITILAVIVAGALIFTGNNQTQEKTSQVESSPKPKIQVIEFNNKKIPLSEVIVATGSDCDSSHYHAKDHTKAKALDETQISDPGGCGYGKVKDTQVLEVE